MRERRWLRGMVVAIAMGVLVAAVPAMAQEVTDAESADIQTLDVEPVVESVTVSPVSKTLNVVGQTAQLTATVSPQDASDYSVTWSSNNTSVAKVDANGLVTAGSKDGAATITATAAYTDEAGDSATVMGTCKVTVSLYNGIYTEPGGADKYYYKNGVIQKTTNVTKVSGTWYNLVNGKVTPGPTVAKNSNGWWYIDKNGKVDFTYTGFAGNSNGQWYMEQGKLTRKTNGVLKDTTGAIGAKNNWYYVTSSKVQTGFTGLANYSNASGWWYITKGKVDRTYNGLAKNKNGWFYLSNGKVNRSYTGFAQNSSGDWYVSKGKVTKKASGLYKDTKGVLGSKNTWYYVSGSKVRYDFNGLASNSSGTWVVQNGKVNRSYNGTYTYQGMKYSVTNGKTNMPAGMSTSMYTKAQKQSSSTKWLVMVDVDNCKVGVFQGSKGNWTPVKCYVCSDGKPSTPTIRGTYSIQSKGKSFGSGYTCWYYSQFHGNYMIHSILYNPGSMTSVQDGHLGYHVSHGCVRLALENAKWIYDNVPIGSRVLTY